VLPCPGWFRLYPSSKSLGEPESLLLNSKNRFVGRSLARSSRPSSVGRAVALIIGSAVSGLMLAWALPLGEQAWLAWFALVPLIVVTRDRNIIVGVFGALGAVTVAALLASSGVLYLHRAAGDSTVIYGACGKFALVVGVVMAANSDVGAWRRPAWFFAALATLVEASQLIDLPAHLALTQYRQLPLLQIASVGGIWAVSFLLWWSNFQIARLPIKPMLGWIGCVAALSLFSQRIGVNAEGPLQSFAAIQVSDADEKNLTALHREASRGSPEFVVWPEFAGMPFVGASDSGLRQLAASVGMAPLITSIRDSFLPLPHNVAALFRNGKESARYAKRKLFGGEKSMHTPGDAAVAVPYDNGTVGLCICFDSCFPESIRETARLPGVTVIALPTIDPPTANYFMAGMHAAYTPFRSAESGVAFVRSDGNAYSQIVDATGRIVAEQGPGDGVLSGRVAVGRRWTLYRVLGDWFLLVCGALVVVGYAKGRNTASVSGDSTQAPTSRSEAI